MWWWMSMALAGSVYVNGVEVTGLKGQKLEDVTVVFDAHGDLRIEAPGYEIQIVPDAASHPVPPAPAPAAPPTPAPAPAAPPTPAPATVSPPAIPVRSPPAPAAEVPDVAPGAPEPREESPFLPNGLPRGRWWLATQDDDSEGHFVQLWINGALVTSVASGAAQQIEDIGPYLRSGENQVRVDAVSKSADGGRFRLFIGTGSNDTGALILDASMFQLRLDASSDGERRETFVLDVSK